MKKKLLLGLALIAVFCMILTACGGPKEPEGSGEVLPPGTIKTYKKMSQLQRDHVYVETDDGYAEPTWGNINFEPTISNGKNNCVAWFDETSWKLIPTIHRGQSVVYRTTEEFDEDFQFTKFMDVGYTIGICNLRETTTGRYKFTAMDDSTNVNPTSDAARTLSLDANVTLDAVDGKPLRGDRVSPCGTITGLKKDQSYPADIYVGTEIVHYDLKADSRALYGAQVNKITDYEFVQAEIIEIEIPSYFKSGYYSLNGFGIFRYVAEEGNIDDIDFNLYNPDNDASAAQLENLGFYTNNTTEMVDLDVGKYTITFTYDDSINPELLPEGRTVEEAFMPSVYLNLGKEDIRYLEESGDHAMEGTYEIEVAGSYPLEIENLYGRGYVFSVSKAEEETTTTAENTTEETTTEAETTLPPAAPAP